jgi:hypothetical protein
MKQTQIPLRVARLHRQDFNPTPSHSPPRARSPAGPAASRSRGWRWRRPPPRAVRIRQSAAGRWASQRKSLHARRVPNRAFRPAGWWRWGRMQTAQRVTRKVRGCEGRADSVWSFWTESCQDSEFTDETSGRIHKHVLKLRTNPERGSAHRHSRRALLAKFRGQHAVRDTRREACAAKLEALDAKRSSTY